MQYNDNRDMKRHDGVEYAKREDVCERIADSVETFMHYFPDTELRVLDVGTRTGYATRLLREMGYDVLGTELIQEYVDEARRKNLPVIQDDILNTFLPNNSFDVVFALHVLEHCRNTETFLGACRRLLREGGSVFVTFPLESAKRFKKKFDKNLGMTTNSGHMVHYGCMADFEKVAVEAGFVVKHLDYSCTFKNEVLFIGTPHDA